MTPPDGGRSSGCAAACDEVVRAVPLALDTYFARRLGQNASAVAYRMLVALAPLAIVLVAIFGLVLRDDELQARVVDWVVEFLPFDESSRQEVENAIVAIASPASLIGFLGLLAFAWTATGVMTAIRLGLEVGLRRDGAGGPRSTASSWTRCS